MQKQKFGDIFVATAQKNGYKCEVLEKYTQFVGEQPQSMMVVRAYARTNFSSSGAAAIVHILVQEFTIDLVTWNSEV